MLAFAKSDIGLNRKTNEDSFECGNHNLYIVADGMGGHLAGEVASTLAIKEIKRFVQDNINIYMNRYEELLNQAVFHANTVIYNKAQTNEIYKGMGTTASVVMFDHNRFFWAHVGDSRIYILQQNELIQLTRDHSLVNDLLENGEIDKSALHTHPLRNMLTRAVGVNKELYIDTGFKDAHEGNYLLLTTDGLTNVVDDDDLKDVILKNQLDLSKSIDCFIEKAISAGGEDNITAILIGDFK